MEGGDRGLGAVEEGRKRGYGRKGEHIGRYARFILSNYHNTASVTAMKAALSLPPLALRRSISRLSLFHKIYFHNSILRDKLISRTFYVSSRNDHNHKVGIPISNTTTFYSSFVPRTS